MLDDCTAKVLGVERLCGWHGLDTLDVFPPTQSVFDEFAVAHDKASAYHGVDGFAVNGPSVPW